MAKEDKNTAIYIAYEGDEPFDPACPERNLLRALLATAMSDLKKPGESSRKATEYFLSKDESYIFSFISVCNHLDIDPKQILRVTGLLKKNGASHDRRQERRKEIAPEAKE